MPGHDANKAPPSSSRAPRLSASLRAAAGGVAIHSICTAFNGPSRLWFATVTSRPRGDGKEALESIHKLADDADMNEIMYKIYVIDKIRKEFPISRLCSPATEALPLAIMLDHEDPDFG